MALQHQPDQPLVPKSFEVRVEGQGGVKVGDLVKLPEGCRKHWKLPTGVAILVAKLPRADTLEYDWQVLAEGRLIALGRQIEQSSEVISESR